VIYPFRSITSFVRPFVVDVLRNWKRYEWTLQGFGMLRAYLFGRELRLHVWDSRFAVPGVTTIHDHPWHFESAVVSGSLTNTVYKVHPCTYVETFTLPLAAIRQTYVEATIVCGPGGRNDPVEMKARGRRVWLASPESSVVAAGKMYRQRSDEVHCTTYEDGTVTLVRREFLQDMEHARVFFKEADGWVSAEPRAATPDEVDAIVGRALEKL